MAHTHRHSKSSRPFDLRPTAFFFLRLKDQDVARLQIPSIPVTLSKLEFDADVSLSTVYSNRWNL